MDDGYLFSQNPITTVTKSERPAHTLIFGVLLHAAYHRID